MDSSPSPPPPSSNRESHLASEPSVAPPPPPRALATNAASASAPADLARPKSPPLAFLRTSNDSLAYDTFLDTTNRLPSDDTRDSADVLSPTSSLRVMGRVSGGHLQVIVDQQANAIQLLHQAFAAERKVWDLERESLMLRIFSLEQLLKTGDHHSPAKSPIHSPGITSPPSRSLSNGPRLPSIAEDENLSHSRSSDTHIPTIRTHFTEPHLRRLSVSFPSDPASLMVEEDPASPTSTQQAASPVSEANRMLAGHIPQKFSRPPTPPPQKMTMDGIEDTPTRYNTHINTFLTRSNDEEEELTLRGPLNLPELPTLPDETNFTLDALSMRLQQLQDHPESSTPMVVAHPSPGMVSPANESASEELSQHDRHSNGEPASTCTRTFDSHHSHSGRSSNLSPTNGAALSHQGSHEQQIQSAFEQGGIKLKKKASTNFGVPFGQLGGFGRI